MGRIDVIGESSWDIECLESQGFQIRSKILHNDFFLDNSNSKNTSRYNRILSMLKITIFILVNYSRERKLVFTSFNFEAIIFARLLAPLKNTLIFCPNVMYPPEEKQSKSGDRLQKIFKKYKGRIIVSDQVSQASLKKYSAYLSKNYFKFSIPNFENLENLTFIVVMPAVLTHEHSMKKSDQYYKHSVYITEWLIEQKLAFKILPHPREEGRLQSSSLKNMSNNFITQSELSNLSTEKCYLSGYSSLSLNKRYGGSFGFWVKAPGIDIIPNGITPSSHPMEVIYER